MVTQHYLIINVSNNLPTLEIQESVEDLGVDPAKVMLGVASNFGASMWGPGKERIEYGFLHLFCIFVHLLDEKSDMIFAMEYSSFKKTPSKTT